MKVQDETALLCLKVQVVLLRDRNQRSLLDACQGLRGMGNVNGFADTLVKLL